MQMEEPFETADSVQKWLVEDRNVPASVAVAVATTLLDGKYFFQSSLLNIPRADLALLNMSPPNRNILFNKLQINQQTSGRQSTHLSTDDIDDIDLLIAEWVSQWVASEVSLGKRKRQTDASLPCPKKPAVGQAEVDEARPNDNDVEKEATDESSEKAVVEAADDAMQAAGEMEVELYPPIAMNKWYRGDKGQKFYLRASVSDLGHLILERAAAVRKDLSGAITFVISGAAGIGKSWSINAYMAMLLKEGINVFFHSGQYGRAWKIEARTRTVKRVDPLNIDALGTDWIYVYDSPGSTNLKGANHAAVPRTGLGKVSLIFSSPKRGNYENAIKKSDGPSTIFNLPTWTKKEMLDVDQQEDSGKHTNAINACYDIWGGNMRALNRFIYQKGGVADLKKRAEEELDAHIRKIDKEFAKKMVTNLEKQDVQKQFAGEDFQDSPGHILVPEPTQTDTAAADCFERFSWHFCSPLAEKKFFRHLKEHDRDTLKDLLVSVFKVPSPKGVLFEKVAHHLVTNGVVQDFRCYHYNAKSHEVSMQFQHCVEEMSFEGEDQLKATLKKALGKLDDKIGSIACEPKDTSFDDAVDTFVVERQGINGTLDDWCLHMLQDTISKTRSFHPLKVLWYCSVFCAVLKEKFELSAESSDLLKRCKYIPVVPHHETRDFSFKTATATCELEELDAVAALLDFDWPSEYNSPNPNWKTVVDQHKLSCWIPKTKDGKQRKKFDKRMVGNAMLMNEAVTEKVESMCQVIFDVVTNVVNG